MAKEQTATLSLTKKCKSCVRFDDQSAKPMVVTSFYLMNEAYEAIGKPAEIELSVKAVK
jgi:hypothetical protein